MIESQELVRRLEATWDFDTGFFGKLRRGHFDPVALDVVYEVLDTIDMGSEPQTLRRLVSLLWYMPLFMTWQRDRIAEAGHELSRFDQATNRIQESIERILGVP